MIRMNWWSCAHRCSGLARPVLAFALLAAGNVYAQSPPGAGQVVTPGSSIQQPGDIGVRAHTNIEIFIPNREPNDVQAPPSGTGSGPAGSRATQVPSTRAVTSSTLQQ